MTAGPFPVPTPLTQPFWDGAARGELRVQRCDGCGRRTFPPRAFCPACAGPLEWIACTGRATVASFAINHRPDAAFETAEPQILALVQLEEGVRMATTLVGMAPDPDAIALGMPVTVVFVRRGPQSIPVFTRAAS